MHHRFLFVLGILSTVFSATPHNITHTLAHPTQDTSIATLFIPATKDAYVYRDYLDLSVNDPRITLTTWSIDQDPITHYDPVFKATKQIFDRPITIHAELRMAPEVSAHARLHLTYYMSTEKGIKEISFPLITPAPHEEATPSLHAQKATHEQAHTTQLTAPTRTLPAPTLSFSERLSLLIQRTHSLPMRLLLVFLLGLLMSLTPCIYPMLPITAGILQAQASSSLLRNIALSLCYTLGIATTFACLGLAAAFAGQLFGSFMASPFVIIPLVMLLVYMGLSMFDLYQLHVPSFLRQRNQQTQGGSLISAFLFGAASGTVASPCLSPGLVLLLSIVTTLASKFLGFILLFAFGFGLGIPLMLVGTFSSSLTILPRAGMWMIEVKHFFGFMLFGMCFYFLRALVPYHLLLIAGASAVFGTGIFYLYQATTTSSGWLRSIKNGIGMGLIIISCIVGTQAYKACTTCTPIDPCALWETSYYSALEAARADGSQLFIDVGAPFCSLCQAIDATLFQEPAVLRALEDSCYCLKINGADAQDHTCTMLQQKYQVVGFPTFLLVDPTTETVIRRWGGELYNRPPHEFIQELQAALAEHA